MQQRELTKLYAALGEENGNNHDFDFAKKKE
jgi:hypothetical protein